MSLRWKDEHMHTFLAIYRNYECLWNNKSANYHRPNVREEAYKSIQKDLNLPDVTVSDIKAKIKTIRTRYCSELAKIKKCENSGDSDVYVPRLFWFKDADTFLRAVSMPKEVYRDSTRINSFIKRTYTLQETNESEENKTAQSVTNGPQNAERHSSVKRKRISLDPEEHNTHRLVDNPSTSHRRRAFNNEYSVCGSMMKLAKLIDINTKDDARPHEVHEFDAFCNSLAIQLKKMPVHDALICQEKLQAVMTQTRLSLINSEKPRPSLIRRTPSPTSTVSGEESAYAYSRETSPNCSFIKEEIL